MVDADPVAAAAHRANELRKPFDEQDYPDDPEAWKKSLSLKFDRHDPEFWFTNAEAEMETFGIFTQWSKRRALLGKDILPPDILDELKPLLRLTKADAGPQPYKDVKSELLDIYGQKDEQACARAASRKLTSRPSALGKQLIHDICPGSRPFQSCHCARVVWWFFINQMPQVIKTQLADKKFNATTYKDVFKLADDVYESNKLGTSESTVVAAVADLDQTQPALQYPVDAVSARGAARGRGS